jgi:ankyrin repeat protein
MRGFYVVAVIALFVVIALNVTSRYRKNRRQEEEAALSGMAATGDTEGLRRELDRGRDVNSRFRFREGDPGFPLLETAINSNNTDCAKLLLERGAKLYPPPSLPFSPLLAAAADRDLDLRNRLEHGRAHHTPGVEIVRMLLDRGAPVDGTDSPGDMPPLFWAAMNNHADIMLELFRHGANVNRKCDGATALRGAVETGSTEAVRLLIAHGTNVNAQWPVASNGVAHWISPLQSAIKDHHPEIAKLLIQAGARK